jgi:sulfur relay protein TusB/DsrH
MQSKLFLLFKSPHEFTGLDMIENMSGSAKRGVILFEDAAYYAIDPNKGKKLLEAGKEVYVMKDDLAARGFAGRAMAGFKEIDYHEAVDLIMEKFDQTITL